MDNKTKELHNKFEEIDFVKYDKSLYKIEFDYEAKPNGKYFDRTNNQMRRDCCYYLQGAWRLYQELNK